MCHASSYLTTTFVYHFCWYGWLLCGVRVEYHPMHSIKFSKTFLLRVLPDLKMHLRTITQATYTCQAGCSSCDLLASVLPVLPLLGAKVPTFICYIYTYIFLKIKTFWKKSGRNGKNGRSAQLSHQLSYHFYWFHRISTTFRKTWRNRMAIYWHTSSKSIYIHILGISIVLVSKNAGLMQQSMHTSMSLSKDAWTWACLILDCQWRSYFKLLNGLLWISPTFVFEPIHVLECDGSHSNDAELL